MKQHYIGYSRGTPVHVLSSESCYRCPDCNAKLDIDQQNVNGLLRLAPSFIFSAGESVYRGKCPVHNLVFFVDKDAIEAKDAEEELPPLDVPNIDIDREENLAKQGAIPQFQITYFRHMAAAAKVDSIALVPAFDIVSGTFKTAFCVMDVQDPQNPASPLVMRPLAYMLETPDTTKTTALTGAVLRDSTLN